MSSSKKLRKLSRKIPDNNPAFSSLIRERLLYPRGVLELLKGTRLFSDHIDKALGDIDFLIVKADTFKNRTR